MSLKSKWNKLVRTPQEILGLVRDSRDYRRQPQNEFTHQGYEVILDFLTKDECDRLIQVADRYLRDRSYSINGNCYLVSRKDLLVQAADTQVQQIMNAQEVDDNLSQLFCSGQLEAMFEQRISESMGLQSITIKVDGLDSQTKRGLHTDNITPPQYKAFIYLNDVDDYGDGPYTMIPGSHRHLLRRIINYLYGQIRLIWSKPTTYRPSEDIKLFYSDHQAVSIFGKAGTLILSNQQVAHKGWQKQDRKERYALVCYLAAKRHVCSRPFSLYRYVAKTGNGSQAQEAERSPS